MLWTQRWPLLFLPCTISQMTCIVSADDRWDSEIAFVVATLRIYHMQKICVDFVNCFGVIMVICVVYQDFYKYSFFFPSFYFLFCPWKVQCKVENTDTNTREHKESGGNGVVLAVGFVLAIWALNNAITGSAQNVGTWVSWAGTLQTGERGDKLESNPSFKANVYVLILGKWTLGVSITQETGMQAETWETTLEIVFITASGTSLFWAGAGGEAFVRIIRQYLQYFWPIIGTPTKDIIVNLDICRGFRTRKVVVE